MPSKGQVNTATSCGIWKCQNRPKWRWWLFLWLGRHVPMVNDDGDQKVTMESGRKMTTVICFIWMFLATSTRILSICAAIEILSLYTIKNNNKLRSHDGPTRSSHRPKPTASTPRQLHQRCTVQHGPCQRPAQRRWDRDKR